MYKSNLGEPWRDFKTNSENVTGTVENLHGNSENQKEMDPEISFDNLGEPERTLTHLGERQGTLQNLRENFREPLRTDPNILNHVRTGSHENGEESLRTSWSHGDTCGSFETWENRKSQKVVASFRTSRNSVDFILHQNGTALHRPIIAL